MTLKKKYWVEIGGDRFDIDETRIAHWERFLPYAENKDFFKNLLDSLVSKNKHLNLKNEIMNNLNKFEYDKAYSDFYRHKKLGNEVQAKITLAGLS